MSEPAATYKIDYSPDMARTAWEALPNEFVASGNTTSAPLSMAGLGDKHFVRVRRVD